jgi:hypothetical protein
LYIGSSASGAPYIGGPFNSVIFNLTTPAVDLTNGVWEYWNGAWVTLTVQDNTGKFSNAGVNGVFWKIPTDWIPYSLGPSCYWVRFRVSAVGGAPTPPIQSLWHPYTAMCPYIDIDDTEITGDVLALLKMRINNVSDDTASWTPGAPDMDITKILLGIRSLDRGADFSAYIPASYSVLPTGMVIYYLGNVDRGGYLVGGSAYALYDPSGAETTTSFIDIRISSLISRQYYGKFALYARVRQAGGTLGDITMYVDILISSVKYIFNSNRVTVGALAENEMLYLGMLEISTDIPDYEMGTIDFMIHFENDPAAGDGDLYIYDLIMMPTDECLISVEGDETWNNRVGYDALGNCIQFIDSITNPKKKVTGEVRAYNALTGAESSISDISVPIYNNALSVPPNKAQRIWFAMEHGDYPITRHVVVFETVCTVMLEKQQRYLAMRGTK